MLSLKNMVFLTFQVGSKWDILESQYRENAWFNFVHILQTNGPEDGVRWFYFQKQIQRYIILLGLWFRTTLISIYHLLT